MTKPNSKRAEKVHVTPTLCQAHATRQAPMEIAFHIADAVVRE